jgi:triacylglycerol lipase
MGNESETNMKKEIPPATLEWVLPPNLDYKYFENCADYPFRYDSKKFDLVNAWWLADSALLAYSEPTFATSQFDRAGLKLIERGLLSGPSTQCYVVYNDNFVLVSFRGTQVFKPDKHQKPADVWRDIIRDVYEDAKFALVDSDHGGFVHRGFKDGLDEVWQQLEDQLNELKSDNPIRTLWFTGHSLGAALATLAADRYGAVDGLYTFGCPLVGDADFKDDFHVSNYRFVNNNDIVTRVPPIGPYDPARTLPGIYRHVGQLKYIESAGTIVDNPSKWARLVDSFRGSFGHLFNAAGDLRSGWAWEFPDDHFNDHGPIFYALHIWNNI